MTVPQQNPRWRKSSRSQNEGACVELSIALNALRDSKNPDGPVLTADIGGLLTATKAGWLAR